VTPLGHATPLAIALSLGACTLIDEPEARGMRWGDGTSAPSPAAAATVNANAALESVRGGGYRTSSAFVHATHAPYPSSVAEGAYVEEWVSSDAYATYSAVRPDASGSGVVLPVGATIVRAIVDATGSTTQELTVMVKGPSGYNPDVGDWWFAVTDPDGTPIVTDAGTMAGPLDACATCHVPRATDDFLFGVPTNDRP
jgi:hypothetical protein